MTPPDRLQQMIARTLEFAAAAPAPGEREPASRILLGLTRFAASAGVASEDAPTVSSPQAAEAALESLLSELSALAARSPEHQPYAQAMTQDLMALAQAAQIWLRSSTTPAARSSQERTSYRVQQGARGTRLTEHREGAEKAFYLTRSDYDAAIAALAGTASAEAGFQAIHQRFLARGGSETATAYPLRIAIRFLRSRKPPLVKGLRRRYQITLPPEQFRQQARQAWEQLVKEKE